MDEGYPFRTLPDHLGPGFDLVFVRINPGLHSVQRGHYFARSTSRFWPAFSASKLSERVRRAIGTDTLRPEQYAELPCFGIGFTDVVKRPSANAADTWTLPIRGGADLTAARKSARWSYHAVWSVRVNGRWLDSGSARRRAESRRQSPAGAQALSPGRRFSART